MYVHRNERDANSITIARESAKARAMDRRQLIVSNQFQNMTWTYGFIISSLPQVSTMADRSSVLVMNSIDEYQPL
jgi:hypothetical protein